MFDQVCTLLRPSRGSRQRRLSGGEGAIVHCEPTPAPGTCIYQRGEWQAASLQLDVSVRFVLDSGKNRSLATAPPAPTVSKERGSQASEAQTPRRGEPGRDGGLGGIAGTEGSEPLAGAPGRAKPVRLPRLPSGQFRPRVRPSTCRRDERLGPGSAVSFCSLCLSMSLVTRFQVLWISSKNRLSVSWTLCVSGGSSLLRCALHLREECVPRRVPAHFLQQLQSRACQCFYGRGQTWD